MSPESKLKQVAEIMARLAEDPTVPRNIRRAANEAREIILHRKEEPLVKAAFAASILDEISNDPNMPMHARTTIWSALSILETVRE